MELCAIDLVIHPPHDPRLVVSLGRLFCSFFTGSHQEPAIPSILIFLHPSQIA